jgi:hypothetical protein
VVGDSFEGFVEAAGGFSDFDHLYVEGAEAGFVFGEGVAEGCSGADVLDEVFEELGGGGWEGLFG